MPKDITDVTGRVQDVEADTTGRLSQATQDARYVNEITKITLTTANAGVVDATYDATEAAVINNMRTRLGEIEGVLRTAGLIN